MNKILKIATVLTWINMIFWCFVTLLGLLVVLASGTLTALIILIFPTAVILHSYAAFQLQKSIRDPAIPLNSQTSTGIRFIGFVALFAGIGTLIQGIGLVQSAHEFLKQMLESMKTLQEQMHLKRELVPPTISQIRVLGVFIALIGLSVAVNVNLNFRLLRWYYFLRNNSNNPEK
ncbi:MAG TPA: hypothetical protein VHD83_18840 [Puia sp.]|nr:hypothetical protein [Puia sp.]